jgi:hypothetical protein
MTTVTHDRLRSLLRARSGPCLSIYMPTLHRDNGLGQNPIRFKNSLREAHRLLANDHSPEEIRSLLAPITAMSNPSFWRRQAAGLAIFRTPDLVEQFRVALPMPELVVVADSFHVRPLIRCLHSNERYFVIAISRHGVNLLEGTASSLESIRVPGLPEGPAELGAPGRARGTRGGHAARGGFRNRTVHAAGAAEPTSQADLARYFRAIDRALRPVVGLATVPVILASVDHYVPIYREVSRLKNLSQHIVRGSPDAMTLRELHERAWPVAQSERRQQEDLVLEDYRRAAQRGRSTEDLDEVVRAARRGRIRRLFLAVGVRAWGIVDPATGHVRRTAAQQDSHDDDVLDDVAEAVLLRGGEVFLLSPDRMPRGREVMAELR